MTMTFKIMGASRDTGADIEMVVDAADQQAAIAMANARGILVASCSPAPLPTTTLYQCSVCTGRFVVDQVYDAGGGPVICRRCHAVQSHQATAASSPSPDCQCGKCGGRFAAESVYDEGGTYVCHRCFATSPKPQASATTAKLTRSNAPATNIAGCLLGVVLLIAFAFFIYRGFDALVSGPSRSISPNSGPASVAISDVSFVSFDSKFCVHSRLTDLQKDRDIETFKGQRVRWEGIVSYVSGNQVGFQHKATTQTYDVLLTVSDSDESALITLSTGDLATYEGTIESYGVVLPHGLEDGTIVSHRSISPGDRLIFLAKTETDAMNQILGNDAAPE